MAYKDQATEQAALAKRLKESKTARDARSLALLNDLLPLPKNKYNHSKPKVKIEPLKYEYLPMEFDEPVKPKKEIKRPKAEGIVSVLNINRIG